jgi:uncharacterized membrane protein
LPLALTNQDAAAFFAPYNFIFNKPCDALNFNCIERQITSLALIAS